MIMILMAILAVLTFVAWLVVPVRKTRLIVGTISALGLILTVGAMTLNFTHHLGMKEVETVETKAIYSAGDPWLPNGIMIAEPLGTAKNHYVMVYRDTKADTTPKAHFKPNQDDLTEATKSHATFKQSAAYKRAEVEVKTTRLEWKNDVVKWLFGTSGQDHTVVSEVATVHVPNDWMVLTQAEAKKMMSQMK